MTRTQTEAAFQAGFITMLGNLPTFLGMIGTAVLIAVLFGVVNTMTLSAPGTSEDDAGIGVSLWLGRERDRVDPGRSAPAAIVEAAAEETS